MTPQDLEIAIKKFIKDKLSIEVRDDPNDRVVVVLLLDGEVISHDYIDYSEVVRIVDRMNGGVCM